MKNNDILRRLRYTFDFNDAKLMELFKSGGEQVTRAEIIELMKKEDEPGFKEMSDLHLAAFLNGFITEKRGKKEGEQPKPENKLNNNIILRKLKIALNLIDEDILDILELVKFRLSKHELSAFFRKSDHQHYRPLQDQILRNFLHGLQLKHKPESGK
ncbi:DUF1456 family protein [Pontibacter sp. HSC-14F20]|uniref:DUF1456 family protein n=1 Tax=Pontibacter sp. HSC-14F20 TaxID=2864136 RepID=UPI001C733122|nr:DUF1456 family protein [Pontibacter sp. HSC-14F20]MBX0331741.1 DUF1456 family protein [Pontibacter sp. HSC-14F20]